MTTLQQGSTELRWRDGLVPVLAGWIWARCCLAVGWLLSDRLYDVLDDRGRLVARFAPSVEPGDARVAAAIEQVLAGRGL